MIAADCGFFHLLGFLHYCLRAISKAVHFAKGLRAALEFFECNVDAAQYGLKRDTGIFPRFDQHPVKGRKQQCRAATALEMLFNFGEVIEVILHGYERRLRGLSAATAEALRSESAVRAVGLGALRSQIMRRPSSVSRSSTALM